MEYNRAVQLKKACLVFLIHEDDPVVGKDFETGPGAAKLQALKDCIGEARVAAFFKSAEDLRSHVVEALGKLAKEFEAAETSAADARTIDAPPNRSRLESVLRSLNEPFHLPRRAGRTELEARLRTMLQSGYFSQHVDASG
jgi:hypothetical protein